MVRRLLWVARTSGRVLGSISQEEDAQCAENSSVLGKQEQGRSAEGEKLSVRRLESPVCPGR